MTRPDFDAVHGCLLGQAVGDALGLPMEGQSRRRQPRLFPSLDRMQFAFGRGMGSDDTEHALMTATSIPPPGPADDRRRRFRSALAWRLRFWFLCCPPGIGMATLKACAKLCVGIPPTRSGVWSAGNGPAMRAAVLGVCGEYELVADCTRVTHTDPKAECGAVAVAVLADLAAESRRTTPPTADDFFARLGTRLPSGPAADELLCHLAAIPPAVADGLSVEQYAERIGRANGVSGYMYHTVPVAAFAFLRHPDDYRAAVQQTIRCGGDTDTTAAIVGALVGTRVGVAGIPPEWVAGYRDWPRSTGYVKRTARRLVENRPAERADVLKLAFVPLRNALFVACVLAHAVRRLLPPY